jgi:ribonuclease I
MGSGRITTTAAIRKTVPRRPTMPDTGHDQKIAPSALRQQLAKSNPGWMPSSFSIQDKGNSLVAVRLCMSRAFEPVSCPRHGDTRNTPITIRARP